MAATELKVEKPQERKVQIVALDEESKGSAVAEAEEMDDDSDENQEDEQTEATDKKEELEEVITDVFDGFKLNMPSLLFYFVFLLRRQLMVITLIFTPN